MKTFCILLFAGLGACMTAPEKPVAPGNGSQAPTSFDARLLQGQWWQVSQSNQDQVWSRAKPSQIRRFQNHMRFTPPNVFATTVLHPTDRHYPVTGSYQVKGNMVTVQYKLSGDQNREVPPRLGRMVEQRFLVIAINDQSLRTRHIPMTTTVQPDAVSPQKVVGAWRATVTKPNTSGFHAGQWTPCSQPTAQEPCNLVLHNNGKADIRVNSDNVATVKLGVWSLDVFNKLVVKTQGTPQRTATFSLEKTPSGFNAITRYSTLYWKADHR